jgi:hypothetical protein
MCDYCSVEQNSPIPICMPKYNPPVLWCAGRRTGILKKILTKD